MTHARLLQERQKAATMHRVSSGREADYWLGYRLGLAGPKPPAEHRALVEGAGSPDQTLDARARGYIAGLGWTESVGSD